MPGPLAVLGLATAGSGLLNYFGGRAQAGRNQQLQRMLLDLLTPQRLGREANNLFDTFRASPMYTGLRTRAMETSNVLGNQLQTSYARRGLGTSGIAATALPIARSSFTRTFADIDAGLFEQALEQARALLSGQASAISGTYGPSAGQFAIGNTLQSIMPLVLEYFMQRNRQNQPAR